MRVAVTIDPRRDPVRDEAESWLRHHARDGWRLREDEDCDRREVLVFGFMDPLDGMDFHHRTAAAEHRGRVL